MATTNIATLDGVEIKSAPVRARDCAFPITNMLDCILGDEVLDNMNFIMGDWEDDTNLPGIVDQKHNVNIPENLDECESGTVDTEFTSIEFTAPNMVPVSLCTPKMIIRDLKEKFCSNVGRNILAGCNLFNADGSFKMGEPYVPSFMRLALGGVENVMGELIGLSAIKGDASEIFQFDGLYTQIDNGWTTAAAPAVADPINLGQVINWATLTGGTAGTPVSVDDTTAAGQTVTLWGETKDVPEGLSLAEFLNDLWIDAVELNYAQKCGGVTAWEMHVGWGKARCFLNATACMQPCGISGEFDQQLRARLADYRATNIAKLYPSGLAFPMLQTKYIEDNTLRFGPGSIGGVPTYSVFFRDYNEILDELAPLRDDIYGTSFGIQWEYDPMMMRRSDVMRDNMEAVALYADIFKESAKCVKACLEYEAGMLVMFRHLWLKIEDVSCDSFVCTPSTDVWIEEEPAAPVELA